MIKNLAIGGGSNRLLLLLALVFGVVCAVLIGVYLSNLDSKDSAGVSSTTVPVVVAAVDIAPLTEITPEMVTVRELPLEAVVTGAFDTTDLAIGQTAQVTIVAGEQVLPSKVVADPSNAVVQFGDDTPLSLVIPDGKRAFSIFLSPVAAAGGLARPGDHVDLILSNTPEASDDAAASIISGDACYVLQDVSVLAIGGTLLRTTSDSDSAGIAAVGAAGGSDTMTLAVSPGEAATLAAVQGSVNGGGVDTQLWVSLRPFTERGATGDLPACGS